MRPLSKNFAVHQPPQLDLRSQVIAGQSSGELHRWYWDFNRRWKNCHLCPLHQHRNRVVQFRGIIPAPICFVGEAPWISEDEIGQPFKGPAGRELDSLLEEAEVEDGEYCLINTLGCIPNIDECDRRIDHRRRPTNAELKCCAPRFGELIQHVNPNLVVTLGTIAAGAMRTIEGFTKSPTILELIHPSFLIQQKQKAGSSYAVQRKRFILTLKQSVEKIRVSIANVTH